MTLRGGISIGAALCACLAGCNQAPKAAAPQPAAAATGPEAIVMQNVTAEADTELNATGAALRDLLAQANSDGMIYPDELDLSVADSGTTRVDWWLSNQGYIAPVGADDAGRAYFSLSAKGANFIALPSVIWFKSTVSGKPTVACQSSGTLTGAACQVTASLSVATLPGAPAGLNLPIQAIQTTANYDPTSKWRVEPLSLTDGGVLAQSARLALLGSPEAADKSRQDWVAAINQQFSKLAGGGANDSSNLAPHPTGDTYQTSFDCGQATGPAETTICGNAQLAALDVRMAQAYRRALNNSIDPAAVRSGQRDWLRIRSAAGADVPTLRNLYLDRIDVLDSLSNQ